LANKVSFKIFNHAALPLNPLKKAKSFEERKNKMDQKTQIIRDILALQQDVQSTRAQEREIQKLERGGNVLFDQPSIKQNALETHLNNLLPPDLIPSNVGDINAVQWGFFYEIDFDFGSDPTWDSNTYARKQFKVTNESAFLITRIYRDNDDAGVAGFEAPLSLILRDLQSSRQFMDRPVPLQAFPSKGYYFDLPVPYLLYPAASAELEIRSWLPTGITINTTGVGTQHFSLYGARVRIQNPAAIMKAMFQKHNG